MFIRRFFALAAIAAIMSSSCGVLDSYGNGACAQNPAWCSGAGGGATTAPDVCAAANKLTYECNVDPPSSTAVEVPIEGHFHLGACGSFYCADNPQDAARVSGAGSNPDIDCVLAGPGIIPQWTFCVPPDKQTGPCVEVGGSCNYDGTEACCETETFAGTSSPSRLECEPDSSSTIGIAGHCRVAFNQPCIDSAQCFSGENTPDGTPAICDGTCCMPEWADCFDPTLGLPNVCCGDLKCSKDATGEGYICG